MAIAPSGIKLLIVDDEPVILKTLSMIFESSSLFIKCCGDPQDAIRLMRDELFHLVLLDIQMPGMLGNELLVHLKKINPLTQIIMMTGYSSLDFVVDCLGNGACDYFTKPFTDITLLQTAVLEAEARAQRWHQVMQDTFRRG
ncbi:MAG: response regulator [SAR324 cluster bacterium]|nr:response regulator [SAR324 cluster bacterium]MBF0350597.1 response regulator [SAR324 cluster bacterium]